MKRITFIVIVLSVFCSLTEIVQSNVHQKENFHAWDSYRNYAITFDLIPAPFSIQGNKNFIDDIIAGRSKHVRL